MIKLLIPKVQLPKIETVKTQWKKLRNRWWHVADSVLKYLPQPVQQLPKKIFSPETKEQLLEWFAYAKQSFNSLFEAIKEEDTINVAEEDIPCGIIANIVYDSPFDRPRKIALYDLIEEYNSIEYCLYRDITKQKYILWYRGTEIKEARDYISDINIIIGTQWFNDRFQESLAIYDKIAAVYPDDIKIITGHSLGGTICYMIAQLKEPDRTVVFNPGSSANPTFLMMMKDTQFQAPWTKRVFTYRILGDIVSTLSVIGYTRTFRKASVNPWDLHAISNFMFKIAPETATAVVQAVTPAATLPTTEIKTS